MQRPAMFYGAPSYIFEKARELRNTMTEAEELLWERLRNRQLNGYKFRRQHPISEFIADFYCHSAQLVIEIDGGIHETKERRKYDIQRTEILNELGVSMIRFSNNEVKNKIDEVLYEIASSCDP